MFISPEPRARSLLLWGTWVVMGAFPAEGASQSESAGAHRSHSDWTEEARQSKFWASIPVDRPEVWAVADVVQGGLQAAHLPWTEMPESADGAAARQVFGGTLVGAMVPLAPALIAMLVGNEGSSSSSWEGLFFLGMHATLVTVPFGARWAGAGSFWRTMIGTGVGYVVGGYASLWVDLPEFLVIPTYALTMAGVSTLIISTKK